jgi:microcystin degradation protein MlrC
MGKPPRIGLAGFFLEANRFAPVTTGVHFAQGCDRSGDELLAELRAPAPRLLPDSQGFVATMDATGDWEPVPLRMAQAYPGGPVNHAWWEDYLADIECRISDAAPLDGVFISSHGAALTTQEDDPDGLLFERIRELVGPAVPVVAVFDLHTNVSRRMTDALSAFVSYRTNPHVDLRERGSEAALLMRRMLSEGPGEVVLEKLPFLPASTDQLIAPGSPYFRLLEAAAAWPDNRVLNISLCGGFPLADCQKCGFSVVVTAARGARHSAKVAARGLAEQVWDIRHDFLTKLTPMEVAVDMAVEAGADLSAGAQPPPRLILADVADNPGGGGGGNTTALLRALLDAGARKVLLGVFTDPALAAQAHQMEIGAVFSACFNRNAQADSFSEKLEHEARVLSLSDGTFVGRRGLVQGSTQSMGPCALLELAGIQVVVISQRQQLLDPAQLEALGIDLEKSTDAIRTLVVKSRGHFRAAFNDFASSHRVIEVDGPGLTTPVLSRLPLRRVQRPMFPLDLEVHWAPT